MAPRDVTGARAVMSQMERPGTHPGPARTSNFQPDGSALRVPMGPTVFCHSACKNVMAFRITENLVASGGQEKLALGKVSMVKIPISSSLIRNELGRVMHNWLLGACLPWLEVGFSAAYSLNVLLNTLFTHSEDETENH